MAKAYSQDWNPTGHLYNSLLGDARLLWSAGPWRNDHFLRCQLFKPWKVNLVISISLAVSSKLFKILHEVIGKRIIVVDEQNHLNPSSASWIALKMASALFRVSSYSFSGSESATMPAP